jgi:very-short-patch-repair endonuclease
LSAWQAPLDYDERALLVPSWCAVSEGDSPLEMVHGWEAFIADGVHPHIERCGSPIERRLLVAMFRADPLCCYFNLSTQHDLGPYRADIALHARRTPYPILLIIEADGRAFHAANHHQVARDKKRDRYMAELGLAVMRFTGSEIFADADACAAQIFRAFRLRDPGGSA